MKAILTFAIILSSFVIGHSSFAAEPPAVITADYPRAFFFRQSESYIAGDSEHPFFKPPADYRPDMPGAYERWEACFSRLGGIAGKLLDEELGGRAAKNIEWFGRFKKAHPTQLVMMHFNGNARDPLFETEKFFAGHWIYFDGTKITADVPATAGETDIAVSDPRLFRVNIGRYASSNDDIGLCGLDASGKPDWSRSEQVQLVSIDARNKTIRVRRGCYGTQPLAFAAGKAYAAAHMPEGPWNRESNLMWMYNYSTYCPKDAAGKQCADVLAEEFGRRFGPGGALAAFDGLEFDVFCNSVRQQVRDTTRMADCNADGRPDNGVIDGVNDYGIGVAEYCRKLRAALGPQRLILGDGDNAVKAQRATGHLNGIESEGWPTAGDWEFREWSDGLNRHSFWIANGHAPAFSYINHRFLMPKNRGQELTQVIPELPWSTHRLIFAAAQFTDSALTFCLTPPREPGELLGVWDEMRQGTANKMNWLGKPLGPTQRLALQEPDVLQGLARPPQPALLKRLVGENTALTLQGDVLRLQGQGGLAANCAVRIRDVPLSGPDLFISLTAEGDPLAAHPPEIPRLAWVSVITPGSDKPERHMTWVNGGAFTSTFYFGNVQGGKADLLLEIDGPEPVRIRSLRITAHPDVILREFERGLVVANPSPRPYTFDLASLSPSRTYRRLRGSPLQDPQTNNGAPIRGPVTIGPKDALFLVSDTPVPPKP
jgi:hypothetical protein